MPGRFLDHVTGGGLEMMVVVQRTGKGIPAREIKTWSDGERRGEDFGPENETRIGEEEQWLHVSDRALRVGI